MTQTTTLIDETLAKLQGCLHHEGDPSGDSVLLEDEARAVLEAFAAKLTEIINWNPTGQSRAQVLSTKVSRTISGIVAPPGRSRRTH